MGRQVNSSVPEAGYVSKPQFEKTGSIAQSDFAVVADLDNTKKIVFDTSAIATGTTVTIKAPASGTADLGAATGLPEYHVSAAVTSNSSVVTSTSFTTVSNSPALSFNPTTSGDYEVCMTCPVYSTIQGTGAYCQITATAGSPTQLEKNQVVFYDTSSAISGEILATGLVRSVYTLTHGTTYTFDLQMKVDSTGSASILCSSANSTMWARQIR